MQTEGSIGFMDREPQYQSCVTVPEQQEKSTKLSVWDTVKNFRFPSLFGGTEKNEKLELETEDE